MITKEKETKAQIPLIDFMKSSAGRFAELKHCVTVTSGPRQEEFIRQRDGVYNNMIGRVAEELASKKNSEDRRVSLNTMQGILGKYIGTYSDTIHVFTRDALLRTLEIAEQRVENSR